MVSSIKPILSFLSLAMLALAALLTNSPMVSAQSAWTSLVNANAGLNSIFCDSSSDCWGVGDDGVIIHGVGSPMLWGVVASPTANNLNSVYCVGPFDC